MTIHIPAAWLPWLAAAAVLLGLWVFVYQTTITGERR